MSRLPWVHFTSVSQSRPTFGIPEDTFVPPRHTFESSTACVNPADGLQALGLSGVKMTYQAEIFLEQYSQILVWGVREGNVEGTYSEGSLGGGAPKGTKFRFIVNEQSKPPLEHAILSCPPWTGPS